jgi:hypothetical protein
MYRKISILFFIIVSQFLYSNKDIWGSIGHKVIGEIASQNLSSNATNQIEKILDGQSLALVSTWADEMRSNPEFRKYDAWHYVNMPLNKEYPEIQKNNKGDIIQAINKCIVVLKNKKSSNELKSFHLKYLVHLVGDIHQPLHVGRGNDKGGNDVKLEWFWESSNLHRVWDSGMIESMAYSYTELTDKINHPSKDQVAQWQSTSVYDWAHEAMTFRAQIYDLPENLKINYEYRFKNWEVVENQLLKGGIRLAGILNEIYG